MIGAVGKGAADTLTIYRPDGTQMVGAPNTDASYLYAPQSPLPGGGNTTLAYVAERSGTYAIRVDGNPGAYDVLVEAYRPGSEIDPSTRVQTIFLDFDGARVNTGIFGGPGVRELSPFRTFIARWGLNASAGGHPDQPDHRHGPGEHSAGPDPEGAERQPRGAGDQLQGQPRHLRADECVTGDRRRHDRAVGDPTIGIAQYIDPGNYGHEDSALVLLDVLSGSVADYEEATLNYYLRPRSNRVAFVSQAVANVISHEIGHYIGNFHTENTNRIHNLMDAGGANFGENLYGVGPDGIGGTADDEDIDFRLDRYDLFEGFTGRENTLNVSAWAFVRGGTNGLQP